MFGTLIVTQKVRLKKVLARGSTKGSHSGFCKRIKFRILKKDHSGNSKKRSQWEF